MKHRFFFQYFQLPKIILFGILLRIGSFHWQIPVVSFTFAWGFMPFVFLRFVCRKNHYSRIYIHMITFGISFSLRPAPMLDFDFVTFVRLGLLSRAKDLYTSVRFALSRFFPFESRTPASRHVQYIYRIWLLTHISILSTGGNSLLKLSGIICVRHLLSEAP